MEINVSHTHTSECCVATGNEKAECRGATIFAWLQQKRSSVNHFKHKHVTTVAASKLVNCEGASLRPHARYIQTSR